MTDIIDLGRTNAIGIASAIAAAFFFSVNDVLIKFLSSSYPLHQVVLIRTLVGLTVLMSVVAFLPGKYAQFRSRRLGVHILRGLCVVFANMAIFLALAAMPLADVVAIFFVSPLIITAFSVLFLGEYVGPRRWAAVAVGLVGVLVVMRPGTSAFQPASLLPLAAAFGYATLHILTRRIRVTEGAVAMTFYIQITFLIVSTAIGLSLGHGRYAGTGDASLDFLLRAWIWPAPADFWVFLTIGCASTGGGYCISQAYRLCEAGLAAPFEYVALPLAIMWGLVVFGDWPDLQTFAGVGLILASGLTMLWLETRAGRQGAGRMPKRRLGA